MPHYKSYSSWKKDDYKTYKNSHINYNYVTSRQAPTPSDCCCVVEPKVSMGPRRRMTFMMRFRCDLPACDSHLKEVP